jgi:hypothetical protein
MSPSTQQTMAELVLGRGSGPLGIDSQSPEPSPRRLIQSRMLTNEVAHRIMIRFTVMMAGTSEGGSTKLDCTPGGGGAAGILDRSMPGGMEAAMVGTAAGSWWRNDVRRERLWKSVDGHDARIFDLRRNRTTTMAVPAARVK